MANGTPTTSSLPWVRRTYRRKSTCSRCIRRIQWPTPAFPIKSGERERAEGGSNTTRLRSSGDRHVFIQIHVLDGIQQTHTFRQRPLKRLPTRDQPHPSRALVDHGGLHGFLQVAFAG